MEKSTEATHCGGTCQSIPTRSPCFEHLTNFRGEARIINTLYNLELTENSIPTR